MLRSHGDVTPISKPTSTGRMRSISFAKIMRFCGSGHFNQAEETRLIAVVRTARYPARREPSRQAGSIEGQRRNLTPASHGWLRPSIPRNDGYSASLDCSIAAGIFATDISERAT